MRIVFFLCLMLAFAGCGHHNLHKYLKPAEPIYSERTLKLVPIDTLSIQVPDTVYNYYHNTQIFEDSLFYGINYFTQLDINVFNLRTGKFDRVIRVDPNIVHTYRVEQFRVVSPDSIYVVSCPDNGIRMLDADGFIVDEWSADDLRMASDVDYILSQEGFGLADLSGLENFDVIGTECFLTLSPVTSTDFEGSPIVKRHGIYDLVKRQWRMAFGYYEGVLKYKGDNVYFYDMHDPYRIVADGKAFVTYPIDHFVYIYDMMTSELIDKKSLAPSFAIKFPHPVSKDKMYDDELMNELRRDSPFYGPLYYHSSVACWSRFYNFTDQDTGIQKRGFIIYDAEFKILYENIFEYDEIACITPDNEGVVVMPRNEMEADVALFIRYRIIL